MAGFLISRLLQMVTVVAVVVLIVFLLMFLSGDPALLLMPPDSTREDIIAFRQHMGFDQPLYVQFARFAGNLLRGDFGESWRFQQPALELVLERVPATAELAVAALLFSLVLAIPIGVISAVKRDTPFDTAAMVFALLGQSTPAFWLGIMLILVFAVDLGWLPSSGRTGALSLVLPALSLGLGLVGRNARLIRSSMLEVLGEDYVKFARAKGLSEWWVINKHALKNALLPVVTLVGLELGHLLGGAVITETVFAWPGIGNLAIQAVGGRDYPVVQTVIIVGALVFVLMNLVVDLTYMLLDPRISLGRR